jgi:hypothetical protein
LTFRVAFLFSAATERKDANRIIYVYHNHSIEIEKTNTDNVYGTTCKGTGPEHVLNEKSGQNRAA